LCDLISKRSSSWFVVVRWLLFHAVSCRIVSFDVCTRT
jgi:hypothetical protein